MNSCFSKINNTIFYCILSLARCLKGSGLTYTVRALPKRLGPCLNGSGLAIVLVVRLGDIVSSEGGPGPPLFSINLRFRSLCSCPAGECCSPAGRVPTQRMCMKNWGLQTSLDLYVLCPLQSQFRKYKKPLKDQYFHTPAGEKQVGRKIGHKA